jgi:hypothetical protein
MGLLALYKLISIVSNYPKLKINNIFIKIKLKKKSYATIQLSSPHYHFEGVPSCCKKPDS